MWVARRLADTFGISLRSVVSRQKRESLLSVFSDKEPLFLVFPVHSWGPAVPMSDFIDRLVVDDYAGQPIYIVCVCGDDCGRTDKIVDKMLRRKGLQLTSVFSVQMPNNYILLPGFDVDAPSVVAEKLNAASARIQAIVEAVRSGDALWERMGGIDRVLIDPPREGAQALAKTLAATDKRPARVVYVSCNPATLARDCAILTHEGGWHVRAAGVMNMFPHTAHVESMAVLEPGPKPVKPVAFESVTDEHDEQTPKA